MRLIEVPKIGDAARGYLSEVQSRLPFVPQRAYYIYGVPDGVSRGGHAHRTQEQVFFCLHGTVIFRRMTSQTTGQRLELSGRRPEQGLYIGPLEWHTMAFMDNAVVLAFGSELHDEREYIRDFEEWNRLVVGRA